MKLFSAAFACALLGWCASAPAQVKNSDPPEPSVDRVAHYIDAMEKYLYVVDHVARLSDNPTASGVAAVLSADDLLKGKPQDAIDYFTKILPEVKNDSVRRAIRLQLADLYKKTNQPEKALEQLTELMTSAPARPARTTSAAKPSGPNGEQ